MTRLPRDVPAKKVNAALKRIVFRVSRVSGSHYVTVKDDLRTDVQYHKSVKLGTLKAILRQVGIDADEFIELLKRCLNENYRTDRRDFVAEFGHLLPGDQPQD